MSSLPPEPSCSSSTSAAAAGVAAALSQFSNPLENAYNIAGHLQSKSSLGSLGSVTSLGRGMISQPAAAAAASTGYSVKYTTDHQSSAYGQALTPAQRKSKLAELINWLRPRHRYMQTSPATSDDIYKAIDVDVSSDHNRDFLQEIHASRHCVIEGWPDSANTAADLKDTERRSLSFYYRPVYPYTKNREALLQLLTSQPAGIDTANLIDSYIGAVEDLRAMRREGLIMQIPAGSLSDLLGPQSDNESDGEGSSRSKTAAAKQEADQTDGKAVDSIIDDRSTESAAIRWASAKRGPNGRGSLSRVYLRKRYDMPKVDNDLRELWHSVKLPVNPADLELRLAEAGHLSVKDVQQGYVEKIRRVGLQRAKQKQLEVEEARRKRKEDRDRTKSKTMFRANQKLTNVHLVEQLDWLKQGTGR